MVNIGQRTAELRNRAGISQQRLSELLGVSRTTIAQIESGRRKLSVDELERLSRIYNLSMDNLLSSREEPEVIFAEKPEEKKVESPIRINVPQRNLEKFKEVLLYILNKAGSKPNIDETVLYKLLYFADFDFYEKYEEQLIGATYIKNHYGPTPVEFDKIVAEMMDKEIIRVESKYYHYPQRKYLPLRKADLSKLKANEIEVIDRVLDRLSDMTATQISNYSHDDVPWLTTEDNEVIEYESVFYRTPIYSVREYA